MERAFSNINTQNLACDRYIGKEYETQWYALHDNLDLYQSVKIKRNLAFSNSLIIYVYYDEGHSAYGTGFMSWFLFAKSLLCKILYS